MNKFKNRKAKPKAGIPLEMLRKLYVTMLRIRFCEERIAELLFDKEIRCPVHLYTGQEAIAAGVCAALSDNDYIFGGHRSHGHYLAKGGDLKQMMAEIYGKETGCSGGRGGSMHLIAPQAGVMGTVPIVAATIPLAAGAALASQLRKDKRVAVSFFGDGAVEEGGFHESMNLAAQRKLPVIFVCENNFYASHLQILERRAKNNIVESAKVYGMPGKKIDGNNCLNVFKAACEAIKRARRGDGPTLLECVTFRWRGHVGPALDLDVGLNRKKEFKKWKKKDPLVRFKKLLMQQGFSSKDLEAIKMQVERDVESAIRFARESALPLPKDLHKNVLWSTKSKEVK